MRGEQPDRAGAEDGHGVARAHPGQAGAVIAGRKDVRQHGEVTLEVVSLRQPKQVEVGVGHAQVLGLTAVVGTHLCVAVGPAVHPLGGVGPQAE